MTTADPILLHGRELHAALALILVRVAPRELSVGELVAELRAGGFVVAGPRPTKTVSDALRSGRTRGYVIRSGRDRYRSGRIPRTTLWRMRDRLRRRVEGLLPRSYGHGR